MDGVAGTVASESEGSVSPSRPRIRREPAYPPSLILIGASTGGPQALVELLSSLGPAFPYVPVCVTLHMPPDLMPVIAAHVTRQCHVPTRIVTARMSLENGVVHFAPGDQYMSFSRPGSTREVMPVFGTQQDFCKAAIDTMFTAGAAAHGSRVLGVVLSGMGTDGLAGARAIAASGGTVLAQDKESSAVWGMPGAVAKANLADAILTPSALAKDIVRRVHVGERRL